MNDYFTDLDFISLFNPLGVCVLSLREEFIDVSDCFDRNRPLESISELLDNRYSRSGIPVRMALSGKDGVNWLEVGVLSGAQIDQVPDLCSFRPRLLHDTRTFSAVMIVPTGVGAELGGHAGDACPAARLLGEACDTLILHPNVVNASDLNELPSNAMYVEGSVLTRPKTGMIVWVV